MNGTMIDFALLVDLAKQTKPETQMMTRINVLEFFGNGSIVEVEGIKRQAGEAPSTKLQAPSKESSKRQATSSKHAKRATNCRMTICLSLYTLHQPQPPAKYTTFYRISKHDKSSHPASIWPLTMVHGSYIMVDMFNFYWRCI